MTWKPIAREVKESPTGYVCIFNVLDVQALLKKVDATGLSAEELIRRALQAALRH